LKSGVPGQVLEIPKLRHGGEKGVYAAESVAGDVVDVVEAERAGYQFRGVDFYNGYFFASAAA